MTKQTENWAASYDAGKGFPPRVIKTGSPLDLLQRLEAESGKRPPVSVRKLAHRAGRLYTETGVVAAGWLEAAKAEIAHLQKSEARDDAEGIIESVDAGEPFDLGPSRLGAGYVDLADAERHAKAVGIASRAAITTLGQELGRKPFENYLAKVWANAMTEIMPSDSTTMGEYKAMQAKAEETLVLVEALYFVAIGDIGGTGRRAGSHRGKTLRGLFEDRPDVMPTLAQANQIIKGEVDSTPHAKARDAAARQKQADRAERLRTADHYRSNAQRERAAEAAQALEVIDLDAEEVEASV